MFRDFEKSRQKQNAAPRPPRPHPCPTRDEWFASSPRACRDAACRGRRRVDVVRGFVCALATVTSNR